MSAPSWSVQISLNLGHPLSPVGAIPQPPPPLWAPSTGTDGQPRYVVHVSPMAPRPSLLEADASHSRIAASHTDHARSGQRGSFSRNADRRRSETSQDINARHLELLFVPISVLRLAFAAPMIPNPVHAGRHERNRASTNEPIRFYDRDAPYYE